MFSDSILLEKGNARFTLYPDKSLQLPDHRLVVVSDTHFGKINHFRKAGIGLPSQAALADIAIVENIINRSDECDVVFLGDLFHSEHNSFVDEFMKFRLRYEHKKFYLIEGNHDIMDASIYNQLSIEMLDTLEIENLLFTHEPLDLKNGPFYNICGHLHPSIRLSGKGRQSMQLPCFYFGKFQGIMPAIGYFTGTSPIKPKKGDVIYGIAQNQLCDLSYK